MISAGDAEKLAICDVLSGWIPEDLLDHVRKMVEEKAPNRPFIGGEQISPISRRKSAHVLEKSTPCEGLSRCGGHV